MKRSDGKYERRTFKWSKDARELVRAYLATGGPRHELIDRLAQISGHPRPACIRFARELGVTDKRLYRYWTSRETETLLLLCESYPLRTVALKLRRPETAVRGMLRRLGASAKMGIDSFTKHVLASLLHVRPQKVQRWIDQGLLRAHREGTERLPRVVITADDFIEFCKNHVEVLFKDGFCKERLEFIYRFVFPRSHVDLLPVRQAKKERAAYAAQMQEEQDDFEAGSGLTNPEEQVNPLGLTA